MAGLGETCTHVAASLFYLEASSRLEEKCTCTAEPCQRVLPAFQRNMEYAEVGCIDFTSAKRKKRMEEEMANPPSPTVSDSLNVIQPSPADQSAFYSSLSACSSKPADLSIVDGFSERYRPLSSSLPAPLPQLFQEKYKQASEMQLMNACKSVCIVISDKDASQIESATRSQARSRVWYEQRAGRITAPRMYDVCHTDPFSPSVSLIKSICYPSVFSSISSAAIDWGRKHEDPAKARYVHAMASEHHKFDVANSGLVINKSWPYLGASPDGMVSCDCCGAGVLEIKCPYVHRGETIAAACEDGNFCLEMHNGNPRLKVGHPYYCQVQTQLFVCDVDYCDFCVCTFASDQTGDLHVQRIAPDMQFWESCLAKASSFFSSSILPELLGKKYTSNSARIGLQSLGVSSVSCSSSSLSTSMSLESHSGTRDKCCRIGCTHDLVLRSCRCGHKFHHICTTHDEGKL